MNREERKALFSRFGEPLVVTEVTVPKHFNPSLYTDAVIDAARLRKNTGLIDEGFNGKMCGTPATELEPGRTYTVKLISITKGNPDGIPLNVATDYLKSIRALRVGMAGIMLAFNQKRKELFPPGKWVMAIDEKKNLSIGRDGEPKFPSLSLSDMGHRAKWSYELFGHIPEARIGCDYYLLAFFKQPKNKKRK